jgi:type III secretory pathway component EscU
MKFELKTENENFSKSISQFFGIVFFTTLIVILCDIALKLEIISRNHKIEYNCRLLTVEKSKPHFKKLSRLSNLKSKQQIWEFCRAAIK